MDTSSPWRYLNNKNSMLPARAAGLGADDQRIRQAKALRATRKKLNVTATREGFGPGARYFLSLPDAMCAQNLPGRPLRSGAA